MPGIEPTIKAQRKLLPGLASFKNGVDLIWQSTLDLVFPPHCASCGKADELWCARCRQLLASYPLHRLERRLNPNLVVVSTGTHSGILRTAIHAYKYEGVMDLAIPLAQRMMDTFSTSGSYVDAIIPVPIHKERRRQRGYNQAELLAEQIAYRVNVPSMPDILVRYRDTASQVNLSAHERQQNVKDAFFVLKPVQSQRFLLVDDVVTTGATLIACAEALIAAGAAAVTGLTIVSASDLAAR